MLLSDSTIDQTRQLSIAEVVQRYIPDAKNKGRGRLTACCPFHQENTPSFHVDDRKGYFRCFGCGAAGDVIGFVMQQQHLDFPEAVKRLATDHGVPLEYQEQTPEAAERDRQAQLEREAIRVVLNYATAFYASNKLPERWADTRKLTADTLADFQIGYAEDRFDGFVKAALEQQHSVEVLERAGLIKKRESDGSYYDVFRGRVMLPIRDERGRVVAFTGRLPKEPEQPAEPGGYVPPKYLNSPDTVWNKGKHLYGLDRALQAIHRHGFVYLMEGNIDVLQFHQAGMLNAVAPCGTALTEDQIKLLKRFTTHVVIVPDNDAPGIKACHKNAQLLIEQGLRVEVLLPADGCDPDDMLKRKLHTQPDIDKWVAGKKDYITGQLLQDCELQAMGGPHDKAEAAKRLGDVLEKIGEAPLRQSYYDDVCVRWPDFKKLKKLVKRGDDTERLLLQGLEQNSRAAYFDFGFWEKEGAYYSYNNKQEVRVCNFTFEVLYFVPSLSEPKYVCRFRHMFDQQCNMAISTDDMVSVPTFKKVIARMGPFLFTGSEDHLNKLKEKLLYGVPEASQPRYMLYNKSGDYTTFANGLFYRGEFFRADRYGMVKLRRPVVTWDELLELGAECQVEVNEEQHLLMSAERLAQRVGREVLDEALENGDVFHLAYHYLPFASSLKLSDDDDDNYETERRYHLPTKVTPLTFAEWGPLMRKAYGRNGMVMVAFYLAALYSDIIYRDNSYYFPLLDCFGQKGSGKTKAAESLTSMFGQHAGDALRLEGGTTPTGLLRRMAIARNGMVFIDEYKNSLPMPMIGTIKGLADRTGKVQGVATGGNQTKVTKPQSAAILGGQDLPTRDPALLSRCIVLEFYEELKRQNDRDAYDRLKAFEDSQANVYVTCEMLRYREEMKAYRFRLSEQLRSIRKHCEEQLGFEVEDRTALNPGTLLTTSAILRDAGVNLPYTHEELFEVLMERLNQVVQIQHTSDDVEQYFSVLTSLVGREVLEHTHFKIQKENDGVTKLFLRVRLVHGFYSQAAQRQGIEMLSASTIRNYLSKHRYYLEDRPTGVRFQHVGTATSAMVFNYDQMREDGIEFDIKDDVATLVGEDDASRQLAEKVTINGNAQALIKEFLDQKPYNTVAEVNSLLKEFNRNKTPQLTREVFVGYIKRYLDEEMRMHDVVFTSNYEKVRLTKYTAF